MRRRLFQLSILTVLVSVTALIWPVDDSQLIRVSTTDPYSFPSAINPNGRTVLNPHWSFFSYEDSEGFIAAWNDGDGWSWIDRRGRILIRNVSDDIPHDLDQVRRFGPEFDPSGFALVCRNSKCGWIDRKGKTRIPFHWDSAASFDAERLARVKLDDKIGWIDTSGEVVIQVDWDLAGPFEKTGLSVVGRGRKNYGCINRRGKVVIPLKWKSAFVHPDDKIDIVRVLDGDGQWGAYDTTGKLIFPPRYNFIGPFDQHGMAVATHSAGKKGWIDKEGDIAIPFRYSEIHADFNAGDMAHVQFGERSVWIDRNGKIAPTYQPPDDADPPEFDSNGLTPIFERNLKGWANRDGKTVIDLPHEYFWSHEYPGIDEHPFYVAVAPTKPDPLRLKLHAVRNWFRKTPKPPPDESALCHVYDKSGALIWSSAWLRFETKCYIILGAALTLAFLTRPKRTKGTGPVKTSNRCPNPKS